MSRTRNLRWAPVLIVLLGSAPALAENEVLRWNRVATEVSTAAGMDPLAESRVLAILQASVHDAVNAIDRRYESVALARPADPAAGLEAAVIEASHAVLVELMPSGKDKLDATRAAALAAIPDGDARTRGIAIGREAARANLAARRADGADRPIELPPGTKPGEYRPTPPEFTPAMFGHWGTIKPFALRTSAQFRPAPPHRPGSAAARAELDEVRRLGGEDSVARTTEQGEIARFWYEDSTKGWNRVARNVAASRGLSLLESARLLALVNLALADGFIGGFEAKYHYDHWRPASAIRDAGAAQWLSYLWTPPVPDYPSTHTVLGAAAAAVLERYFETDLVPFEMTSGAPYAGITRRFWSFSEAARENGASRIFAGLHFRSAIRAGYEQGDRIGAWVFHHALRPLPAVAKPTVGALKSNANPPLR
jgi:hypothetical protein